MALIYMAMWGVAARLVTRLGLLPLPTLAWRAVACTALFGPLLVARYDAVPAALTMTALYFLCTRRWLPALLLVLLGGAAKLYPLLLLPLWVAALIGSHSPSFSVALRRLSALGGSGLLAGLLGLSLLGGRSPLQILHHIRHYDARPIQIESLVGSTALALGGRVFHGFGSDNITFPGAE